MTAIPGPALTAAYNALRERYAPVTAALAPLAVPVRVRPSVVHGWSRDDVDVAVLARVQHFTAHGMPLVLRGTPYQMVP